ncbi:MAG TPA: CaiB/BaiF CoA-transferase family protein [Paracoccaceae bacterium]|nr:CaiB/BaiF CoA-transferase family protein [Paracoccaceae bacterium]
MSGPLTGLQVVEMAGIGPCPMAGQMLADLGAAVVVIDRRAGEDVSAEVNRRGKRSVALDLKTEAGVATALHLIGRADVLIEGFRPGVMERLGLGPDPCLKRNPGLVYGRITGWGQEGPLAASAGHDLTYLGLTGALHAMGKAGEPPMPPLNLVADYGGGGMFLLAGVLAALWEKGRSGRGQVVDSAMVDGVPAMLGLLHGYLARGLWLNRRAANALDGAAPWYRCYACADGRFLAVAAIEPQFFAEFLRRAGLPDHWRALQRDRAAWPEMAQAFAARIAEKTRDEWAAIFEGSDACTGPVLDWEEAPRHPHMAARGSFIARDGIVQAAVAPRFARTPGEAGAMPTVTGTDTEAVLAEAGWQPPG